MGLVCQFVFFGERAICSPAVAGEAEQAEDLIADFEFGARHGTLVHCRRRQDDPADVMAGYGRPGSRSIEDRRPGEFTAAKRRGVDLDEILGQRGLREKKRAVIDQGRRGRGGC